MYDSNPTLLGVAKEIDETKQGQAYGDTAFDNDVNVKKFYIESYGCAMNFSDSEIVASILNEIGYKPTKNVEVSDLILINTCSIRES
jgi:tRNA-2-methylthio-N6-dimethylallyladenosine synthase